MSVRTEDVWLPFDHIGLIDLETDRSERMNTLYKVFGFMFVLAAMASVARADTPVPEIDPGTAGSALTLLVGGLFMLKDRIRGKGANG
jgi:hypothetical protein